MVNIFKILKILVEASLSNNIFEFFDHFIFQNGILRVVDYISEGV